MKKRYIIILAIAVMCIISACKGNEDEEIYDSLQDEALNVETDAFYFDDLINLVGEEKTRISELPGLEKQDEDLYSSQLFGEDVTIKVVGDEELISNIDISFENTDSKSLENAISEQLGTDAAEQEGGMVWNVDGITVQLDIGDQENIVMIMKD